MKFSTIEIKHLFWTWFLISFAFANLYVRINLSPAFFVILMVSSITVGLGVLLHELAHKEVAQRFRCTAEFRANFEMLFMAIVFSFFGFILAAPGGVYITGNISRKKHGQISAAGIAVNIILAIIFLLLFFIKGNVTQLIANYGAKINSLLAGFNLIPYGPFDGRKIFAWDKRIYFIFLIIASLVLIFSYSVS